jgi:CheY-like chemotaxis protein
MNSRWGSEEQTTTSADPCSAFWNRERNLRWGSPAFNPFETKNRHAGATTGNVIAGVVHVDVAPDALICELGSRSGGKDFAMSATRPPGGSVFLVEDEVMIRMMVADMLDELGFRVSAEAGEIGEALRLAQSAEFDLAILDVNVNGKVISPVAELIKARNRPFIFATGYGSSGLPEEYRDRPALQKPFQIESLAKMIDTALGSPAA